MELANKPSESTDPAIILRRYELVRAQNQLGPLILIHSLTGVVQVLEVLGWHLRRLLAQQTLESTTAIHELHVRAHVGLAAIAADRSHLAKVHDGRVEFTGNGARHGRNDDGQGYGDLLHHLRCRGHTVHRGAEEAGPRITLILRHELGRH